MALDELGIRPMVLDEVGINRKVTIFKIELSDFYHIEKSGKAFQHLTACTVTVKFGQKGTIMANLVKNALHQSSVRN